MNRNANGGVLYEFDNEYIIRGVVSTSKAEEIAQGVVKTVNEYPVTLGDIATVTVHIKKIREKIEFNTAKPQYIETIWGVGYRFKV